MFSDTATDRHHQRPTLMLLIAQNKKSHNDRSESKSMAQEKVSHTLARGPPFVQLSRTPPSVQSTIS